MSEPISHIDMSDPAYGSKLTDAEAEVHSCMEALRAVCERYRVPHLLIACHPRGKGAAYQMMTRAYDDDGTQLYEALAIQIDGISGGRLCLAATPKAS